MQDSEQTGTFLFAEDRSVTWSLLVDNLQLLLVGGNGAATDLSVHLSESEKVLFVFLGLALLERVRSDGKCLAYKMLLGRLVNSGMSVRELERKFGHADLIECDKLNSRSRRRREEDAGQ